MRYILALLFFFSSVTAMAQPSADQAQQHWVDSVYASLSPDERIGQLIVARLSSIDSRSRKVSFYDSLVSRMVEQYNIGGICLFQGNPVLQAG
ncbi:MAG TPA: hypothetical protein PKW54_06295, partial [Ferruginibacter sp.]|nr:hypothetical protein [Ferruginibacter sp.]